MQKIAVVSDIHGNILALEAVADDIGKRNVDIVFNLGDHVSGPLWPQETVRFLLSTGWKHILGNHDRQLTQLDPGDHGLSDSYAYNNIGKHELDWIASLPQVYIYEETIFAFHGSPNDDLTYLLETIENGRTHLASKPEIIERLDGVTFPIVVCGHTHQPRVILLENGTTIVNPGSVGLQGYRDTGNTPHIVEVGSPHARYAIITRCDNGKESIEFISLEYDWEKAAEKADSENRGDWAMALRTGFVRSLL